MAVKQFATRMESRLQDKDAEYGEEGWLDLSVDHLLHRLQTEYEEMRRAVSIEEGLRDELVDVANLCMMVEDRLRDECTAGNHERIHRWLHKSLDQLVADYIGHTKKMPSETNLLDFMNWSAGEKESPTEP